MKNQKNSARTCENPGREMTITLLIAGLMLVLIAIFGPGMIEKEDREFIQRDLTQMLKDWTDNPLVTCHAEAVKLEDRRWVIDGNALVEEAIKHSSPATIRHQQLRNYIEEHWSSSESLFFRFGSKDLPASGAAEELIKVYNGSNQTKEGENHAFQ